MMNYSTAIFLVEPSVRCVSVSYDPTDTIYNPSAPSKSKPRAQSFKTLDPDIKVGDLVTIPTDTRHGFTVGKVEEVDLAVNYESNEQMRWIVGVVDKANYDAILAREEELVGKVRTANVNRERKRMRDALLETDPELANLTMGVALPAPSSPPTITGDEPKERGGAQPG